MGVFSTLGRQTRMMEEASIFLPSPPTIPTLIELSVRDGNVLMICTATNFIDASGLEMLEELSDNLKEVGVTLHLAEVKGPVMDRLKETDFYRAMQGEVFFTTDIAFREMADI